MMREWPEPKTWTIRPARIVWANQSAAVRIWFCCSETQSISWRQRARYSAEGEFKVEVWIFRSSKFKVQSSKSRKKQGRKEKDFNDLRHARAGGRRGRHRWRRRACRVQL